MSSSVGKKLMGVWWFLDVCLLAAGAVTLALSIVWKAPNPVLNLVFSPADLTAGTILGIFMILTWALSIGAIVQKNHVTIGLVILNWVLIVDSLGIIIIGTFIWVYTLHERNNYHEKFNAAPASLQIAVQDKFKCCGYFNTSDSVVVGGFCQSDAFAVTNNVTCVTPITGAADVTLQTVFSTVDGYMIIVTCLFLASLCVIKQRNLIERFKRIDSKRGGRGFV